MAKKKHTTDAEHAGHEPATADTDPAPDAPVAADAQPPPREATAADAQPPPREATAEEAAEFDAVHGAPSDDHAKDAALGPIEHVSLHGEIQPDGSIQPVDPAEGGGAGPGVEER
jgi:hypothetical protein